MITQTTLQLHQSFSFPTYGNYERNVTGRSICEVAETNRLLLTGLCERPTLPTEWFLTFPKPKVVVQIIADGLGHDIYRRTQRLVDTLAFGHARKITCAFPSTTPAGVPILNVGGTTQTLGLAGWWVWLAEAGRLGNLLPFMDDNKKSLTEVGMNGSDVFDGTPIYEILRREGITSLVISPYVIGPYND